MSPGLVLRIGAVLVTVALLYLALWPVPVSPVAWEAPDSPAYVGDFAANDVLARADSLSSLGEPGPEAIIADDAGRLYTGTADGWIIRYDSGGTNPQRWVRTGGRPLGMAFDSSGTLWCADGALGLIAIAPDGGVRVVATEAEGVPIGLADYVDVARDGRVYVSDATTKFGRSHGHALEASLLEILEHRGNGRLLEYDPATDSISVLLGGLVFANGVAITHDDAAVLVTETGSNRVLRVDRLGPGRGAVTTLIDALSGFPDNITRGLDGRYWIALVSPRNALVDRLAPYPFLRKVVRRLPDAIRPAPVNYSHIVAVNDSGRVLESLQDPSGHFPMLTHALEHDGWLYLGSLAAPHAARLRWPARP